MDSPSPARTNTEVEPSRSHHSPIPLVRNDIFVDDHGTRFRLLDVFQNHAWIINLTNDDCWPTRREYSDLVANVNSHRFSTVKSTVTCKPPFFSAAANARKKNAYKAIRPLISNPAIYDPNQRGSLVRTVAADSGLSKTTVNKYLRTYWIGGQTEDALAPDFQAIGKSQFNQTNRRGRRAQNYEVYQMGKLDIENLKKAIKKYFIPGETHTLTATHAKMIDDDYSYFDGNENKYNKPSGERPSINQFRNAFKQLFPLEVILKKRKGIKDFNRDHNEHLSGALIDVVGAGHIYEIDAIRAPQSAPSLRSLEPEKHGLLLRNIAAHPIKR